MCIRDRQRRVKEWTRRDHIRNEEIRKELNIYTLDEKIEEYRGKLRQHLSRLDEDRIPVNVKSASLLEEGMQEDQERNGSDNVKSEQAHCLIPELLNCRKRRSYYYP